MKTRTIVVLGLALFLSACSNSMRITGVVSDARTGEPVGHCGIVSGPRSTWTDPIGRYRIGVRPEWQSLQLIAPGYETKTVPFNAGGSRTPTMNVQMSPKVVRKEEARPASTDAPRAAAPVHPLPAGGDGK